MSYVETKQHRNSLANLVVFNREPYGIPLPTHFSPRQFTLAAMDNFYPSDTNSLAGNISSTQYSNDIASNKANFRYKKTS